MQSSHPEDSAVVASVLEKMLHDLEEFFPGRCIRLTQAGPHCNQMAVVLGWTSHGDLAVRAHKHVGRPRALCFILLIARAAGRAPRVGAAGGGSARRSSGEGTLSSLF